MHRDIPMADRFAPVSLRGLIAALLMLAVASLLLIEAMGGTQGAPLPIAPLAREVKPPIPNEFRAVVRDPEPRMYGLAEVLH